MADSKKTNQSRQSEADKAFVEKAKSVSLGRGSKAAEKQPSYSLFDAESGKRLLSDVPREEAASEKTRLKHDEQRNSILKSN